MHGLINRSIESFLRGTYGHKYWRDIVNELDLGFESFEPMFRYDEALTRSVVDHAAQRLGKSKDVLLEDFGTSLIVDRRSQRVRRLLRFGGVTFTEFLHSLEDLPGRARLAVAEIDMPDIEVDELEDGEFSIVIRHTTSGFGHVILGALRALADDYGALAYLEFVGRNDDVEQISVHLLDMAYSEGRLFELAIGAE
ncbi:heme NO-binding domain-containing protein [Aliiroseovarius sp. KMU-50]|uniref:Heme NO-binding domain-containing protein n=1 Tax=Aliiroseovarius salicola TaxID=3009082 RepID=A0ABT4W2B9_9RHOB|nr:heme NO-binding domain-containing protein [Aliiroseovarius sp. KMU-50]MDA5094120.1 heme NO-binding domain-containing protein [Aliiroseovarius sp. KMU-50]